MNVRYIDEVCVVWIFFFISCFSSAQISQTCQLMEGKKRFFLRDFLYEIQRVMI